MNALRCLSIIDYWLCAILFLQPTAGPYEKKMVTQNITHVSIGVDRHRSASAALACPSCGRWLPDVAIEARIVTTPVPGGCKRWDGKDRAGRRWWREDQECQCQATTTTTMDVTRPDSAICWSADHRHQVRSHREAILLAAVPRAVLSVHNLSQISGTVGLHFLRPSELLRARSGPWLRKSPACRRHVATKAKCRHILPKCPCPGVTILIPTLFCVEICRHPPNFPLWYQRYILRIPL